MSNKYTQPMIPLSAILPIAVEAIRSVTGCPDVENNGLSLVDELQRIARAAAGQFGSQAPMTTQDKLAQALNSDTWNLDAPAQQAKIADAMLNRSSLITEFCSQWSGGQRVLAGDVLDWLMQQPVSEQTEPHGWITMWPAMGGGRKPIYSPGAVKPSYGPELDALLNIYPVFTHAGLAAQHKEKV